MRIVQIAPRIHAGTGQAGVAWNLERAFSARGHQVESFTMETARRRPARRAPGRPFTARVARAWRLIWWRTAGTRRARRFLAERPGSFSICHEGVLAGDVYVDHGILLETATRHGRSPLRIARNPALLFVHLHDRARYRGRRHRAVVTLSKEEARRLAAAYGFVRPRLEIIPNGVDLERFRPPSPDERRHAREVFRLDDDARVALFVGHDFARKGIVRAIRALEYAPSILLLVVGGDLESVESARAEARAIGVEPRVLFAGVRHDLPLFFAASDMFVFPSSYEANALVLLEALASGLPVITTAAGYAEELVVDGENGFLTSTDPREIGDRLEVVAAAEPEKWRERSRSSVLDHSWDAIADRYLALAAELS